MYAHVSETASPYEHQDDIVELSLRLKCLHLMTSMTAPCFCFVDMPDNALSCGQSAADAIANDRLLMHCSYSNVFVKPLPDLVLKEGGTELQRFDGRNAVSHGGKYSLQFTFNM